jgi:hypothetical protein
MREILLTKIRLYSENSINLLTFSLTFIVCFFSRQYDFNMLFMFFLTFVFIRAFIHFVTLAIYFFSFNIPFKIEEQKEGNKNYIIKHFVNGDEKWYYENKLHREQGKPALVNTEVGIEKFFFNGKEVNKHQSMTLRNKNVIDAF